MKMFWKNKFHIHMMLRYIEPHNIGWGPGEVRKPWFLRVNATTLTDIDVLNIERGPRENIESGQANILWKNTRQGTPMRI